MKRKLKIERTGDFFRNKDVPKIRLQGKWLADAGIDAGYVIVENPKKGVLVIREVKP